MSAIRSTVIFGCSLLGAGAIAMAVPATSNAACLLGIPGVVCTNGVLNTPTSTGILNEAPIATLAGSKTLLDNPTGIALDSQGNMYVANELHVPVAQDKSFDRGRLTVYPAGSSGNIAPLAFLSTNPESTVNPPISSTGPGGS